MLGSVSGQIACSNNKKVEVWSHSWTELSWQVHKVVDNWQLTLIILPSEKFLAHGSGAKSVKEASYIDSRSVQVC